MISASGRPYHVHVLRMLPGEDVRDTLEKWCEERSLEAGAIVSAVGSVSKAMIRFGGKSEGTIVEGDLEVCALSGTLSRYGIHLHIAVADPEGRMTGGHLLAGTFVRTTLEIFVQEVGGLRLLRKRDDRTGFRELFPETIVP